MLSVTERLLLRFHGGDGGHIGGEGGGGGGHGR
jgi:hypothetical protein